MDNTVNNVFAGAAVAEAPLAPEQEKKAAKKEEHEKMIAAYKQTVSTDPEFLNKIHTLSNSVEVVHTLGYGVGNNVVVDKKASTPGNRVLTGASATVGYQVRNIGEESISYLIEEYAQGEDGKFVGTVTQKQMAPGEIVNFPRKYMTMFCAQPEISFKLANGIMVASSSTKSAKNLDDELASYSFRFTKGEDGVAPGVNDDTVKISIDTDGVVKDEYLSNFGYLNNPKEEKVRQGRGKKNKPTAQALLANYVNKLMQQNQQA